MPLEMNSKSATKNPPVVGGLVAENISVNIKFKVVKNLTNNSKGVVKNPQNNSKGVITNIRNNSKGVE